MPCTALRGCVLSSGVADIREPSRSRGFIFVMAPIYPLMTGKRTTDTSSRGSYDVSGGPLVIVDRASVASHRPISRVPRSSPVASANINCPELDP